MESVRHALSTAVSVCKNSTSTNIMLGMSRSPDDSGGEQREGDGEGGIMLSWLGGVVV